MMNNNNNISTPLMRTRSKLLSHTRSSSLPSHSHSHPLIPQFNHHLQNLHAADSIATKLTILDDLYNCLDSLLLLHHTHQVFARESDEKWVQQVLDGYLGLVDACATAKDLLSHAREYLLHLLSLLRRRLRDSDDLLTSRKKAKKMIHKSLRNISSSLKHKPSVVALDKDEETIAVVSMLREAESATVDVIESLLFSVSGTKRVNAWSLVSRLVGSRKITWGQDQDHNKVDAALEKLIVSFRTSRCGNVEVQIDELHLQLRDTEASLCVIEDKVENLFKRLIRTRVSLLNMHSH